MAIVDTFITWALNNTAAISTFVGVLILFYLFKLFILQYLKRLSEKTKNDIDDFLVEILKTFGLPFGLTLALIIALLVGGIAVFEQKVWGVLIVAVLTYQIVKVVGIIFDFAQAKVGKVKGPAPVQGLKTVIYMLIWVVGALSIISLLGYNVNSILAGLGIGGIAVALAVQNILGDVFSSFSIYFDKPFAVGDYIVVGDIDGTVEKIGMKSTRVRSLRGEQVVLSNRELTNQVIQNFGLLKRRRVVDVLGLAYETPNSKLEKVPQDIKSIVESLEEVEFERIYFKDFGDSALLFELSYYVNSDEYEQFTQVKHRINLDLKAYFEKEKIGIAYPTRAVYLHKT